MCFVVLWTQTHMDLLHFGNPDPYHLKIRIWIRIKVVPIQKSLLFYFLLLKLSCIPPVLPNDDHYKTLSKKLPAPPKEEIVIN